MQRQPAASSHLYVGRRPLPTWTPISENATTGTSHNSIQSAGQPLIQRETLLSAHGLFPNSVGVKAHRNDPKYSPSCPACGDPEETNSHFLLWRAPSRLAWRQTFITSLETELRRLQTSAPLILFLVSVFQSLLARNPIPPSAGFGDIFESQASIGWMAIFRGYWSSEWFVAHHHLVLTLPVLNTAKQKERYKKQDQWLGKVASLVMRQVHNLWILRNNEQHGVAGTLANHATKQSFMQI
jgi:hypothetical protein